MFALRSVLIPLLLLAAGCDQVQKRAQAAEARTGTLTSPVERGRYLATVMACADCHNVGSFGPKPEEGYLQGGTVGFDVPGLGIFYPPNLTPDPAAGIGKWSKEEIVTALRTGKRPDGRILAPAMPWHSYSALTDEDAGAIAAYLKSLAPSAHRVPPPATKATAPQPYLTVVPPGSKG